MYTKANRTLGCPSRNLYQCPQDVKEAAYRGLVRPILEYGAVFGIPKALFFNKESKKVQNMTSRFVTSNYCFGTWGMAGILEKLKLESLKKRRRDSRLIFFYKGL